LAAPDIFTYLNYRTFLKDWFDARKEDNPRYSHRVFMRQARLKSPSALNNVIRQRQQLTERTARAFSDAMKLTEEQRQFFLLLVRLDRAELPDEKHTASEAIRVILRRRSAQHLQGDLLELLNRWYYPAVIELLRCEGAQADPDWIASKLWPPITPTQAKEALDALVELGLAEQLPDGRVLPNQESLATPPIVQGQSAYSYHHQMLELASKTLRETDRDPDFLPPDRYWFGGLTIAVPRSLMGRLRGEIIEIQNRLMGVLDDSSTPGAQVYQCLLYYFPLSAPTATEGDEQSTR